MKKIVNDVVNEMIKRDVNDNLSDIKIGVPYKIEKIKLSDAYNIVENYQFALIYMISEIILRDVSELKDINWEECLEARFFSEDKEIHIFDFNGEKRAVKIQDMAEGVQNSTDNETDDIKMADVCLSKYEIQHKFGKDSGKGYHKLLVQEYLNYDEDGQMYVSLTRLKGLEV